MRKFKNWLLKTHLDVQEREDIRRDLAEQMKFVPPDLCVGQHVFCWQEETSKIKQGRKSGKWLKVEIIAVKGSMAVVNTGATIFFQANTSKLRRPLDTGFGRTSGLARASRRAFAVALSDNSHVSAILDRQGFQVAAPIDLRTKKAESFSPQLIQGFWQKLKKKNPKIVIMISPTFETKDFKKEDVVWQQEQFVY